MSVKSDLAIRCAEQERKILELQDRLRHESLPSFIRIALACQVAALNGYLDRTPVRVHRDAVAALAMAANVAELERMVGELSDDEQTEVDRLGELFCS